jgi:hypothetical protein
MLCGSHLGMTSNGSTASVILNPALDGVSGHLQAPTALPYMGEEKASVATEAPLNKGCFYTASTDCSL